MKTPPAVRPYSALKGVRNQVNLANGFEAEQIPRGARRGGAGSVVDGNAVYLKAVLIGARALHGDLAAEALRQAVAGGSRQRCSGFQGGKLEEVPSVQRKLAQVPLGNQSAPIRGVG